MKKGVFFCAAAAIVLSSCGNLFAPKWDEVYLVKFSDPSYKNHVIVDQYSHYLNDEVPDSSIHFFVYENFPDGLSAGAATKVLRRDLPADSLYIAMHGDYYLVYPVALYVLSAGTYKAYTMTWQEFKAKDSIAAEDMVVLDDNPFASFYPVKVPKNIKDFDEFKERVNKLIDKGKFKTDKHGYIKL